MQKRTNSAYQLEEEFERLILEFDIATRGLFAPKGLENRVEGFSLYPRLVFPQHEARQ